MQFSRGKNMLFIRRFVEFSCFLENKFSFEQESRGQSEITTDGRYCS